MLIKGGQGRKTRDLKKDEWGLRVTLVGFVLVLLWALCTSCAANPQRADDIFPSRHE